MSCGQQSAVALRERGRRATPQRVAVAEALRHSGGHMTANEVISAGRAAVPLMDTSTVYRTLAELRDAGLIAETPLGYGGSLYEWIGEDPHQHLKCKECGTLERLDSAIGAGLARAVSLRHKFAMEPAHLVLDGTCRTCQIVSTRSVPPKAR